MKQKIDGLRVFVAGIAFTAVALVVYSARQAPDFPGLWAVSILVLAGFLTENSSTKLRTGEGTGSLVFIITLATVLLFGAFWAGCVAAVSTGLGQLYRRRPPIKLIFNVSQQVASVVLAATVYRLLGGPLPPDLLVPGSTVGFAGAVRTVGAFFTAAFTFFVINSLAVSSAVALSSGRSLRQVWRTNTLWVLGYDLGASSLSLLLAWLYLRFNQPEGLQRLGFLAVMLLIFFVRHIYTKLHSLQHLYDELDRAYEKLELNVREQLEMMVKSIEARDPYTSGHSRRVAALSKAIATDLGLDAQLVDEIENAALLHDVGKIHAEFAPLLSKEGRLTEEEWEIMKTHATKSADLVALFSRFQGNVLDSVRWHHERWDGKGYPDGIAEEAIPLGARIIMVSDTIDAMGTDRPYRKALSFEKVVSELVKYRGIQFDPNLVDVTVNSVTVRRLVSDKQFLAEQTTVIKTNARQGRPALRSQKSFWEGLRASVGQEQA